VAADGAETLPGERDELRGGLGRGEQREDGGAARAEQRGQCLRRGRPAAVISEHSHARVRQGVTARLVPCDPSDGAQSDRDEEEPRAVRDFARRPVEGVDLEAAVAEPAHAGTHSI
jgi:hypothetical protein